MKLVTFRIDAEDRAGLVAGDVVLDLAQGFAWLDHDRGRAPDAPALAARYGEGVLGFVQRATEARPAADELLERHAKGKVPRAFDGRIIAHDPKTLHLRAPIPRPPSMRDGYAFRQHVETARRNRGLDMIPEFDQFPVFYFTNHQSVIGPGELRVRERQRERLDFELEAAVVIGRLHCERVEQRAAVTAARVAAWRAGAAGVGELRSVVPVPAGGGVEVVEDRRRLGCIAARGHARCQAHRNDEKSS